MMTPGELTQAFLAEPTEFRTPKERFVSLFLEPHAQTLLDRYEWLLAKPLTLERFLRARLILAELCRDTHSAWAVIIDSSRHDAFYSRLNVRIEDSKKFLQDIPEALRLMRRMPAQTFLERHSGLNDELLNQLKRGELTLEDVLRQQSSVIFNILLS